MNEREELLLEVEQMKRFLDLADIREFIYDIKNDILENMRYGNEREVFYKGSLSGWEEDYRKNRMARGGEGNVSQFCDALREGRERFEIQFGFKGLTRVIKGVTVDEPGRGKIVYGVLMIGQNAKSKEELAYKRATDRDPMLNMLNKKAITDYAQKICAKKDCPNTFFVFFDLDNFKIVNDTFGHLYGDEVLVTITEIINDAVGENGIVGRIGGDEILIITKGIADKAELRPMLREIRSNIETKYQGKMGEISLTCSMGAAAYPEHADSYTAIMELADKMLYLAKEKGKNRYLIYTPELHKDLLETAKETENEGHAPKKHGFAQAFNKIGIIQFMMNDYLRMGTSSNEMAFSMVGDSFKLSEILIVYDYGKVGFRWTPQEVTYGEEDLKWIALNRDFYGLFDENSLFIIDGLYSLEKHPELAQKLKERDIQSALFYRLLDGEREAGYVLFGKKVQRQKWSEYELLALSTIAKIFEMSVYK